MFNFLNDHEPFHFKTTFLWLVLVAITTATGFGLLFSASPTYAQGGSETIAFSQDSIVTHQPFQLTMNNLVDGTIRYATNGSWPVADSTPYTEPIAINAPTVIRAQVFDNNGIPGGRPYTKSYIIANYDQTIPVISIVTDWANLDTLHANLEGRGKDWERPMTMEYFAPGGESQFNVNAGIRIHGHFSRLFSPKKSYRIYFRKDYGGLGKLEYPLFEDAAVTKFDKLVLRAGFNDTLVARDIPGVSKTSYLHAKYISDQVVRNLHRDMGQPIAHGSWVLLYLNGEFWGLYNLTERIDDEFLQSYSDPYSQWDVIAPESGWDELGR